MWLTKSFRWKNTHMFCKKHMIKQFDCFRVFTRLNPFLGLPTFFDGFRRMVFIQVAGTFVRQAFANFGLSHSAYLTDIRDQNKTSKYQQQYEWKGVRTSLAAWTSKTSHMTACIPQTNDYISM